MDYYLRVRDQGSRSQILQRCRPTLTAKRLVLIWTPRGSYDSVKLSSLGGSGVQDGAELQGLCLRSGTKRQVMGSFGSDMTADQGGRRATAFGGDTDKTGRLTGSE